MEDKIVIEKLARKQKASKDCHVDAFLDPVLYGKLKQIVSESGRSMRYVIEHLLEFAVEHTILEGGENHE